MMGSADAAIITAFTHAAGDRLDGSEARITSSGLPSPPYATPPAADEKLPLAARASRHLMHGPFRRDIIRLFATSPLQRRAHASRCRFHARALHTAITVVSTPGHGAYNMMAAHHFHLDSTKSQRGGHRRADRRERCDDASRFHGRVRASRRTGRAAAFQLILRHARSFIDMHLRAFHFRAAAGLHAADAIGLLSRHAGDERAMAF